MIKQSKFLFRGGPFKLSTGITDISLFAVYSYGSFLDIQLCSAVVFFSVLCW